MFYVIYAIIGYVAYMFGAFAFCQIVGGIRARAHLFAIVLWSVLTIALWSLVYLYLNKYLSAFNIGLLISLIVVLLTPKIE